MLIAQALGEYGATTALVDGLTAASIQLEESVGDFGTEGVVIVIVAAVIWKMFTAVR